jgi:DNA repair protein RecN (Recombination protein N)
MLKSIYIKNIAIIDELSVNFEKSLNIITGETGAGKSIIVNTIGLLLGERFTKNNIRTGKTQAIIEGKFITSKKEVLVRRVFNLSGTSKSFINNKPVKIDVLKKIAETLIDMHGQHDHQRILNPNVHIEYVDAYGDYNQELLQLSQMYHRITKLKSRYSHLMKEKQLREEKKELYTFQLKELELLDLEIDMDIKLSEKYEFLSNQNQIKEKLFLAHNELSITDTSISAAVSNVNRIISNIIHHHKDIAEFSKRIESIQIELDDLSSEINHYQETLTLDEQELVQVAEQLGHIELLKRKYGGSVESVIDYLNKVSGELNKSTLDTKELNQLDEIIQKELNEYQSLSRIIHKKRKATTTKLEAKISTALKKMDMQNTQFIIELTRLTGLVLQENGQDVCEFLISTNIGERLKPLIKIASGGEISRIMLAIKVVLQHKDMVGTLVFDEIDSGISGATAEKIGRVIEVLSNSHQILCITHLSQIASKGEHHFHVFKQTQNDKTYTNMELLSSQERVNEIAKLISGTNITDISQKQAIQLLGENYG